MVPTFSAGDGSRRLKPGALAPKGGGAPATAYSGRALRDGDGWCVEIDDAYEIRGYGETVDEATAEAVEALASAFGIPAALDHRRRPRRRGARRGPGGHGR